MKLVVWRMKNKQLYRVGFVVAAATIAASCSQDIPPHLRPLSTETMGLLGTKGMSPRDDIFVRIFKTESELEVWKRRDDGHFYHFKTYPICNWSGALGPKLKQGDKQSPEGFYRVARHQMNPNSSFHLAFNLGYPNAYDRSKGRSGNFLMVHGDCRSAGCYAMTDALVEEIYALAREAFDGGQSKFDVHALPFRMTDANMKAHRRSKWFPFWKQLKEGYDYFEMVRKPPRVDVCGGRYLVNAKFVPGARQAAANAPCPPYIKGEVERYEAPVNDQLAEHIKVPGRKVRNLVQENSQKSQTRVAESFSPAPRYGLTRSPKSRIWPSTGLRKSPFRLYQK